MCGRFTLTVDPADLQAAFDLTTPLSSGLAPRYNVAPTQHVAAVPNREPRHIELFHWGLIPSWAKEKSIGNRMINARAETVAEKPSFRTALKKYRCLILADGFYEWKANGRAKTPMYIQMKDGRPFAFAGLWAAWRETPDAPPLFSCTVITTEPNKLMAEIHDRMPVILKPEDYATWLTPDDLPTPDALALLKAFDTRKMKAVAVSTLVNNPRVDSPDCVRPVQ